MTKMTKVAVFIDAENIPAKFASKIIDTARRQGDLTIARAYGGVSGLEKWQEAMAKHHILPMPTPPAATKENASDFALTIDAVSFLYRELFDVAIIASSDADFMQLALHIREHGKPTVGLGEKKSPDDLRRAYRQFVVLVDAPAKKAVATAPAPTAVAAKKPPAVKKVKPSTPSKMLSTPSSVIDREMHIRIYNQVKRDHTNVTLQKLGTAFSQRDKNYKTGYRTIEKFLNKFGDYKLEGDLVVPADPGSP